MNKFTNNVIAFAGGEEHLAPYEMFVDYYNHYRSLNGDTNIEFQKYTKDGKEISFSEKEAQLNDAIKAEILRVSNITNFSDFPTATWHTHPTLRWATFAVVSTMIDTVLPDTLQSMAGQFAEIRNIGLGDIAHFTVKPNELFVVSKASRLGKRTTEVHKQFSGEITVTTEPRQMTVYVSLIRVLEGKESLAEFVTQMIRSFEYSISVDIYNAFSTAMNTIDNTAGKGLRVAGYSDATYTRIVQAVRAYNGGGNVVAMGTQTALSNILPDNANYRFDISSDFAKTGIMGSYKGAQLIVMPQLANTKDPFTFLLPDDKIYFLSAGAQKIVKLVLEGQTLAWQDDAYDRENLNQTATMWKSWGAAVVSNTVAGVIELT